MDISGSTSSQFSGSETLQAYAPPYQVRHSCNYPGGSLVYGVCAGICGEPVLDGTRHGEQNRLAGNTVKHFLWELR